MSQNIVFFSHEHWDNVWRRNQFICAGLLERNPSAEILWVGPQTDIWNSTRHASNQPLGHIYTPEPGMPRFHVVRPVKPLPNVIGKSLNEWLLKTQVVKSIESLGWTSYITWVNYQLNRRILPLPHTSQLIYDITDDWTKASLPPHILQQTVDDDEWMLAHADHVIVCSDSLFRNKKRLCKNIQLIRNGVTIAPYLPEALARMTTPQDIHLSGSVAGYIGTLHEDRLDIDLIVRAVKILPEIQFVFVGPNALSDSSQQILRTLPNCHILGARPYEQMPNYLARFDVCITPHVISEFTESLDPIKMYEYMATGKPIVSTPCAGFRDLDGLVYIANNHEQFAKLILRALSEKMLQSERVKWAHEHTWERRIDEIERLLQWSPIPNQLQNVCLADNY